MNIEGTTLETHLFMLEYYRLKDEQLKRMEYRDQMLHVHLGIVGATMAWSMAHEPYALLAIPWVCFVLGWAYLVNDERISAIGRYIREQLRPCLERRVGKPTSPILGWEVAHRADQGRTERRVWQMIADQIAFVASGLLALGVFLKETWPLDSLALTSLVTIEAALLVLIGFQFFKLGDFERDRPLAR